VKDHFVDDFIETLGEAKAKQQKLFNKLNGGEPDEAKGIAFHRLLQYKAEILGEVPATISKLKQTQKARAELKIKWVNHQEKLEKLATMGESELATEDIHELGREFEQVNNHSKFLEETQEAIDKDEEKIEATSKKLREALKHVMPKLDQLLRND
jgi:hypothetical protein